MTDIQRDLFSMQDPGYRIFHSRLMPTVDPGLVIGVRMPDLRRYAKTMVQPERFLLELPHTYYEENNLHGLLIAGMRDFNAVLGELERFLPCIDNWATCDLLVPKCFGSHREALLPHIRRWLTSDHPYTVRFGLGMLMHFYLDSTFLPEYLDWAAALQWDDYYVNMMIAWYVATALAKQYDAAIRLLEQEKLPRWTHNKSIQKAIESYRISPEQKTYLRTLRRRDAKERTKNL